jgi:hypothetical protein
LCDPSTGEALGQIVRLQGKATDRAWDNETADGFTYRCRQRDLDHWLRGNAPVVLVVCRPSTDEAYWVSVKDYFSDAGRRAQRVVQFSKVANRFSADAFGELLTLAARGTAVSIWRLRRAVNSSSATCFSSGTRPVCSLPRLSSVTEAKSGMCFGM